MGEEDYSSKKKSCHQKVLGEDVFTAGYRERIDFGEEIGQYVLRDKNNQIIAQGSTTKGIAHHSKNGVHIIPSNPDSVIK